ncbi:MAG: class I SAM-dependent methyltransferase, partial [Bacteroidales bacterium]|nr:class I SAM-dependent methyltransferase [Bacteroidales bacterium]
AQVRQFFGNTAVFLERNYVTSLRLHALEKWTQGMRFGCVIDVACGDGSLGLSLLPYSKHLTLLDLSPEMLEVARRSIPAQDTSRVELINADLMEAELPKAGFDLVICTGMLAHTPQPEQAFHKLASLCAPGGSLLLQNTNDHHPYSCVVRAYGALRRIAGVRTYPLSRITAAELRHWAGMAGLKEIHTYRSIVSFMFLSRHLSGPAKGRIVRTLFGTPNAPRRQILGNDEIILFRKEHNG